VWRDGTVLTAMPLPHGHCASGLAISQEALKAQFLDHIQGLGDPRGTKFWANIDPIFPNSHAKFGRSRPYGLCTVAILVTFFMYFGHRMYGLILRKEGFLLYTHR